MSEIKVRTLSGIEVECENTDTLKKTLDILREYDLLNQPSIKGDQPEPTSTPRSKPTPRPPGIPKAAAQIETLDPETEPTRAMSSFDVKTGLCVLKAKLPPTGTDAQQVERAVLATLLAFEAWGRPGQKGTKLLPSLRQTGYPLPSHPAHILDDLARQGNVTVSGARRGRSYALTSGGRQMAQKAIEDLRRTIHGSST